MQSSIETTNLLSPQQSRLEQFGAGQSASPYLCQAVYEVPRDMDLRHLGETATTLLRELDLRGDGQACGVEVIVENASVESPGQWMESGGAAGLTIRIAESEHGQTLVLLRASSVFFDRASLRLFARKLFASRTQEPGIPYANVARIFRTNHDSKDCETERRHWRRFDWKSLSDSQIPFERRGRDESFHPQYLPLGLSGDEAARVAACASALGCNAGEIVSCLLLWVVSGGNPVAAGLLEDFRSYRILEEVVGPLAVYAPAIVALQKDWSLRRSIDALREARRQSGRAAGYLNWDLAAGGAKPQRMPLLIESDSPAELPPFAGGVRLRAERWCGEPFTVRLAWNDAAELGFDATRIEPSVAAWIVERVRALAAVAHSDASWADLDRAAADRSACWLTGAVPLATADFVTAFEESAQRWPHRPAVRCGATFVTYAELDRQSRAIAQELRRQGASYDRGVALLMGRSVEWVAAMLGVLRAGGYFVPVDPTWPRERVRAILRDLDPVAVLLSNSGDGNGAEEFPAMRVDVVNGRAPDGSTLPAPLSESLAYVIYTSGSTGTPKGVAITRANLAHYNAAIVELLRHTADRNAGDAQMQFAHVSTLAADLGNTCLFPALATGACLHLLDDATVRSSEAFAQYLEHNGIDVLKIVPGHWAALAGESSLPLPRRALFFGGEALTTQVAECIASNDAVPVINHYGPTETTVGCLAGIVNRHNPAPCGASVVPLGTPLGGAAVLVLDEQQLPVAVGTAGEIYVSGPGVARGYENDPRLTAERFLPAPHGAPAGARMYRTGDRGRVLPNGQVEFLGRTDHQVKIRGYRVELPEIERAIASFAGVEAVAVVLRSNSAGQPSITAHTAPRVPLNDLRAHLNTLLPDYMIPAEFVLHDQLPRNANGKIDRANLPQPESAPAPASLPQTARERTLAEIWCSVLGVAEVGIHDDLFAIGGDSISSIQIASRATKAGIPLTPMKLFRSRTIAACLEASAPPQAVPETAGKRQPDTAVPAALRARFPDLTSAYPLSPSQHGMLFDCLLRPGEALYVSQYSCAFAGDFDAETLGKAWRETSARHEILRTSIVWEGLERPLNVLRASVAAPDVRIADWSDVASCEQQQRFETLAAEERATLARLRPEPLSSAVLIRVAEDRYRFLWTYHHLILDGWSLAVFASELGQAYEQVRSGGAPTVRPAPSYREYVDWIEARPAESGVRFWRGVLQGSSPCTLARQRINSPEARHTEEVFWLEAGVCGEIAEAARRNGVTQNTLAHAVWAAILRHWTHRDDPVSGVVVSGRNLRLDGVERMAGPFVNTIPMRYRWIHGSSFAGWVSAQHRELAEALEHEHLPLAKILEAAGRKGTAPLFDAIFSFQNLPATGSQSSLMPSAGEFRGGATSYPLSLDIEPGERWKLTITLDSGRFAEGFADRLFRLFEAGAKAVAGGVRTLDELALAIANAGPSAPATPSPSGRAAAQGMRRGTGIALDEATTARQL